MELCMEQFYELNGRELEAIDGGGPVALFGSMLLIGFSAPMACVCPPAGAGMALVGAGIFYDNMR